MASIPRPTLLHRSRVHNLRAKAGADNAVHLLHPRFPLELRNQIYRKVACDKQMALTPHYTIKVANDTYLGLCLVNRQIYEEYQAENTRYSILRIYVNLSFDAPNWDRAFSLVGRDTRHDLALRVLGNVWNVELRTHYKCTDFSSKFPDPF
nr:hypothetical protein CFP56_31833 [Quercus suber]